MDAASLPPSILPPFVPFERILAVLRERARQAPSTEDPDYIDKTRAVWNASAAPLPPGVVEVDIYGLRALWIVPENLKTDNRVLFLHGGGFVFGSPETHCSFVQLLSDKLGANMLVPDYRLAPEHPFPCAVFDAQKAAEFLLENGPAGAQAIKRIAVMGDSAGGNLALSLGFGPLSSRISALGLFSPWVDLSHSASWRSQTKPNDPVLTTERLLAAADAYIQGGASADHLASPILGELSDLPPALIAFGKDELLADDLVAFGKKAACENPTIQLREWDEVVHAWHLVGAQLEQGRIAIEEIVTFIAQSFEDGDADGA